MKNSILLFLFIALTGVSLRCSDQSHTSNNDTKSTVDSLQKADLYTPYLIKSQSKSSHKKNKKFKTIIQNTKLSKAAAKRTRHNNSKVYYTGPRGGCYYYSASGGKVYVDRSLCR